MANREFSRTQRVADYLKRELAELIQQEMRDPRVGMVNINDVEVSKDYAHAKVFVTFVGKETDQECEQACETLNHAAGFLRSAIAAGNQMRTTPRLFFKYDRSVRQGQHLSGLIDRALAEDRKKHLDQGGD